MLNDDIIDSKYKAEKNVIKNTFNILCNLFFGAANSEEKKAFIDFFNNNVTIKFLKQGDETQYLRRKSYGVTYQNKNTGKINIEIYGYEGIQVNNIPRVQITAAHELCHAFCDLFCMRNSYPVVKDGIEFRNALGLVKQYDQKTKEKINWGYYGKFYNETMMDIVAAIATRSKIAGGELTIDDIFALNYEDWGNGRDAYSALTSVARLTIAAFSNVSTYKYQDIVNLGGSIFRSRARKENQQKSFLFNDFLYGIICDPLHIDMVYDRYMGAGSFRDLSIELDDIFKDKINGIPPKGENIKIIMDKLQMFANLRVKDYYRKGILNHEEFEILAHKFNDIFNKMQKEYAAYFSSEEIGDIHRRASQM